MNEAPELLPCPFCGGTDIRSGHVRDGRCLGCTSCGAVVRAYHPNADANAREKWNTRAAPSPETLAKVLVALDEPKIYSQHFRNEVPLSALLFALASQEGNDGDEGNAMQAAGEFIRAALAALKGERG